MGRRGHPCPAPCLWFAAAVFAAAIGGRGARAEPPKPDFAAPRAAAVADLDAFATSVDGLRLYRLRDRVFGVILRLAPDNVRARTGLKYRRDPRTKAWVQAQDYREPVDWAREALPKAEARLDELLGKYRDAVLGVLSSASDLSDAVKEEQLDDLAALLPGDRSVHELRGDVFKDRRWLMAESVEALAQREAFHAAFLEAEKKAQGEIRPTKALPSSFEGEGYESSEPPHRAFGWTGERWTKESLDFVLVGAALSAVVLRMDAVAAAGPKETLLFPTYESAGLWMRRNPKRATARDAQMAAAVGALTIEDGTHVVYFADESFRRTAALSASVYDAILRTCPEGREERAWILYGLGNRIMRFVTKIPVAPSINLEGTERLREETGEGTLPERVDDWLPAAAALLADRGPERLARVLTITLNAMKPSDLMIAYGLAAYLREGKPDAFQAFLEASRTSSDAAQVVRDALKTELPALARRLRRWLLEQKE